MAKAERLDKADLREDKFIETMMEGYQFLKKNMNIILAIVGVILAVLIALSIYSYIKEKAETKASVQFGKAMELFKEAEESWLDQDKMEDATEKYRQARDAFKLVVTESGGSSYADKAAYYAAKAAFQLGEVDTALAEFSGLADSSRSMFGLQAQIAKAKCYEQKGEMEKAIQEYDKSKFARFAHLPGYDFAVATAMLYRAELYESLGQIDKAIADYKAISDMFHENLAKDSEKKAAEISRELKQMMKALFKETPPSMTVESMIAEGDSLGKTGKNVEALKMYLKALREYRIQKESEHALSLRAYQFILEAQKKGTDFLDNLKKGDEKLANKQVLSAFSYYEKAVGIDFAPGRDLAEKAEQKLAELQ